MMEKASGDRDGDDDVAHVAWCVLDLAQWGGLLSYLQARYPRGYPPRDDAQESKSESLLFLITCSERLGILDEDANKTGRRRGHDLTRAALTFLWQQMLRKSNADASRRVVLTIVQQMSDALTRLFGGEGVCVNTQVMRAELALRVSLRATLREAELLPFARRM